jgi:hypothetical protein
VSGQFWLGAFLIAIVLFGRDGVLGAGARLAGALVQRQARADAPSPRPEPAR